MTSGYDLDPVDRPCAPSPVHGRSRRRSRRRDVLGLAVAVTVFLLAVAAFSAAAVLWLGAS